MKIVTTASNVMRRLTLLVEVGRMFSKWRKVSHPTLLFTWAERKPSELEERKLPESHAVEASGATAGWAWLRRQHQHTRNSCSARGQRSPLLCAPRCRTRSPVG